jgi:CBS domain-containing protein
MSLEQYCRQKRHGCPKREHSIYDAVRALQDNHIGAIIVYDAGRVVGIVTDRDLLLRVLGLDLDPVKTHLGDIMTREPATLSIEDSEQQAIELMRAGTYGGSRSSMGIELPG